MAARKKGRVIYHKKLSQLLEIFRIVPDDGSGFPAYRAGQYMALTRDNCRLTKKVVEADGSLTFAYDVDEHGKARRGPVTHSYSIASSPHETEKEGYLEFYVGLEVVKMESPGRLSESLFQLDPAKDNIVQYVDKIAGEFTLERRTTGVPHVAFVGTGTGLAPFASMVKQLYYEAMDGKKPAGKFTLIHSNRSFHELGYHRLFQQIEASKAFDFVYLPSVSRPTKHDMVNTSIGKGRANNILRSLFGMPQKEEEDLHKAGDDAALQGSLREALGRVVRPALPDNVSRDDLRERFSPAGTLVLTCGNPRGMEDIKYVMAQNGVRCEMEEW